MREAPSTSSTTATWSAATTFGAGLWIQPKGNTVWLLEAQGTRGLVCNGRPRGARASCDPGLPRIPARHGISVVTEPVACSRELIRQWQPDRLGSSPPNL